MRQGFSFSSFAAKIGVGRRTLYDWCRCHPEFWEAYEQGYSAALLHFEKQLNNGIQGKTTKTSKGINPTLLIFALKTRFHKEYGSPEKLEISARTDQPIDITQINDPEELEKLVPPIEDSEEGYKKIIQRAQAGLELLEKMKHDPLSDYDHQWEEQ